MDRPEPSPRDEALSRLYALAEGLAADVSVLEPDWCQIAINARELAERADRLCRDSEPLSAHEN